MAYPLKCKKVLIKTPKTKANAMRQVMPRKRVQSIVTAFLLGGLIAGLAGCGSGVSESPSNSQAGNLSSVDPVLIKGDAAWVGGQEYVDSGVLTPLAAGLLTGELAQTTEWRQVAGPSAYILNASSAATMVLLPFVQEQAELLFEAILLDAEGNNHQVQQSVVVMPLSPVITIADPWLRTASSTITLQANFDNTIFTLYEAGELPAGSTVDDPAQQVAVDIVWTTPRAQLERLFNEIPLQVVFEANREGGVLFALNRLPVDLNDSGTPGQGSNLPPGDSARQTETQSLQFDIVLPDGRRSPVTLLVAFAEEGTQSSQTSESSSLPANSSAAASASSMGAVTPSSAQPLSSLAGSSSEQNSSEQNSSEQNAAVSSASTSSDSADAILAQAIADICTQVPDATSVPAQNTPHVANPYMGAVGYVDGDFVVNVEDSQNKVAGDAALVAAMEMVKHQPTGVWLDSRAKVCGTPADGSQNFIQHLKAAQQQGQASGQPVVLTAVIYNLPGRDCVRQERIGELPASDEGMAEYREYIDQIAALSALFPEVRIAAILEPNAFATTVSTGGTIRTQCGNWSAVTRYKEGLTFALNRFSREAQIYSYLDYGDPSWPGTYGGEAAFIAFWQDTLLEGGSSPIDGISLNVAGYIPLEEPFMLSAAGDGTFSSYTLANGVQDINSYVDYFADYLKTELGIELPFIVDTARNGWGGEARRALAGVGESFRVDRRNGRDSWCNIDGSGLGAFPSTDETVSYVWVLALGVSQGNSTRGCDPSIDYYRFMPMEAPLPAGEWFHDYFTQLVVNANPALIGPAIEVQPLLLAVKVQPLAIPVLSKADVAVTATLPQGVAFSALSINFSGQTIVLPEQWQGLNSVQINADFIPKSYFFDELRFNARGDNGEHYAAAIPLTDRQPFDGSPATDVVLDGQGGFADFYRPYQAELADYTYSNNGYAGDDFLWADGEELWGGQGNDYLQGRALWGGEGDDTLAFLGTGTAGHANGGDGNDIYYVTDGSVVILTDTAGDTDIVHNIRPLGEGQRYIIDVATQDQFQPEKYTENDLMIMVVNAEGRYVRQLFLYNFFATVPHFAEVHLADGQVITPDTARAMIWSAQTSSAASSSSAAAVSLQ